MASQAGPVEIAAVVRDVVAKVAPDEVPVVDGLAALGTDAASRRLAKSGTRREPLGFGLGDVVVMATPVVWVAVEHITGRLADSATDSILSRLRRVIRRRKSRPDGVRLPLASEQLGEVRRKALEAGARQGLTPEQSEEIADAIVARLALGDTERE